MKKLSRVFISIILIVVIGLLYLNNKDKKVDYEEEKMEENIEVNKTEEKTKKKMSIVMVGDALIHDSIYNDAYIGNNEYDFSKMFHYIEPLIKDYDLKYYNQETIIGGKDLGLSNYPLFNSPDEIGSDLVNIGFNMVSLANNHSLDKGEAGLNYSVNFWNNQEGVINAGSYASWEDRNTKRIYETNGIKYAFLSYTVSTNGLKLPEGKEYLVNVYDKETVKKDIEEVKDVDVIIVAMHWGDEYTHTPTEEQKEIADYLSELGVNLIIGCHPHVIQPVDFVGDTLVIYSLGNFISSQKSLGLNKIIGLMVGVDIIVEDDKVSFENINYELLYTYNDESYRNFKIIPFKNLTNEILNNYEQIEQQYLEIVNSEVYYD